MLYIVHKSQNLKRKTTINQSNPKPQKKSLLGKFDAFSLMRKHPVFNSTLSPWTCPTAQCVMVPLASHY